jgi:tRNA C32,U32 (ribose-2'-O)-methylase TrmJ
LKWKLQKFNREEKMKKAINETNEMKKQTRTNKEFKNKEKIEGMMQKKESMIQTTISIIEGKKKKKKLLNIARKIAKRIQNDEEDVLGGLLY